LSLFGSRSDGGEIHLFLTAEGTSTGPVEFLFHEDVRGGRSIFFHVSLLEFLESSGSLLDLSGMKLGLGFHLLLVVPDVAENFGGEQDELFLLLGLSLT